MDGKMVVNDKTYSVIKLLEREKADILTLWAMG